jgi:hypothetical protein
MLIVIVRVSRLHEIEVMDMDENNQESIVIKHQREEKSSIIGLAIILGSFFVGFISNASTGIGLGS